jgi:hypothetical protein
MSMLQCILSDSLHAKNWIDEWTRLGRCPAALGVFFTCDLRATQSFSSDMLDESLHTFEETYFKMDEYI